MEDLLPKQVVGAFNRRESGAITWIYNHFYGWLFALVSKFPGCSDETEDLVADIFLKLLRHEGKFRRLKSIKYFLYQTAKNLCLDRVNREIMIRKNAISIQQHLSALAEQSFRSAQTIAAFRSRVYEAIERLPDSCREVFMHWFKDEMTNAEIADKLGITEKTVANRKSLAISLLKMDFQSTYKKEINT